jgi:nucleoside-diphosphate-sugar epimerase
MKKTVMITGADGFIGKYIVSALEKDFNIHPVRENIFHIDWEKRITDSNPDYLIHLAWETKEGYLDSPNNLLFVMKSIEMYNAFFRHGGRRAVFIGTEQEYRRSDLPLKEDSPLKPESLYAECKAGLGSMLVKDSLLRGYGFVWCRLFFVYGFGEKPKRLVPALINGLLDGNAVTCSCADYVRDYLSVEDVASAVCRCLFSGYTGVVNIAGGKSTTIGEIARFIRGQIGTGDVIFRPHEKCMQPMCIQADISLLRSLGWSESCTLEQGLIKEIEAYRQLRK